MLQLAFVQYDDPEISVSRSLEIFFGNLPPDSLKEDQKDSTEQVTQALCSQEVGVMRVLSLVRGRFSVKL